MKSLSQVENSNIFNAMKSIDFNSLASQRWFLHKNNSIKKGEVIHQFDISDQYAFCVLQLVLDSGEKVLYGYPIVKNTESLDLMLFPEHQASFMNTLFQKSSWSQNNASLTIHYCEQKEFNNPFEEPKNQNLEQSNSSILFKNNRFLKWYRFLNPGIHPEVEAGIFLQQHNYNNTAETLAYITYEDHQQSYVIGIVQKTLHFEKIAWDYFCEKPDKEKAFILGKQLASLHQTLSMMDGEYRDNEKERLLYYWESFKLNLMQSESQLKGNALYTIKLVQSKISELEKLVQRLIQMPLSAPVSRIHGDLHLGQILYEKDRFFFIDFEGEPLIPLNKRREKRSVLFDVACIIRSFQYAKAVFKWPTVSHYEKAFLEGYGVCSDAELLFFIFQKTLYEASYELKTRPDWFYIPAMSLIQSITADKKGKPGIEV